MFFILNNRSCYWRSNSGFIKEVMGSGLGCLSRSPSLPPLHHLFFKSHQDGTLPLRHCSLAFRAMPVKRDAERDDEVPYSSFSLSLCPHNSKTNRCQRGASWVLSEEDLSTHKGTFIGLPSISGDQREQEQTPESSDR